MNLDVALKQLRLSALAQTLSLRLQEAASNRLSHAEFLELILHDEINVRQRQRVVDLAVEALGGTVHQKRIAMLGVTFKPESDDVRDSPALDVAVQLKGLGAEVIATDPEGIENARGRHPQLDYTSSTREALRGADLVVLVTEWREYRGLDPVETGQIVADRRIIDGRNVLDPAAWRAAGWAYRGLGRP